jgi:hypothetical protein
MDPRVIPLAPVKKLARPLVPIRAGGPTSGSTLARPRGVTADRIYPAVREFIDTRRYLGACSATLGFIRRAFGKPSDVIRAERREAIARRSRDEADEAVGEKEYRVSRRPPLRDRQFVTRQGSYRARTQKGLHLPSRCQSRPER